LLARADAAEARKARTKAALEELLARASTAETRASTAETRATRVTSWLEESEKACQKAHREAAAAEARAETALGLSIESRDDVRHMRHVTLVLEGERDKARQEAAAVKVRVAHVEVWLAEALGKAALMKAHATSSEEELAEMQRVLTNTVTVLERGQ
jgi:hypothetical protein